MADQGRWFKVWTSILDDLDFQDCSLDDIGRWALLGAMTKMTGTNGVLRVRGVGRRLCQILRVESSTEAKRVLARLPNVILSDGPISWPHGHDKSPVYRGAAWSGCASLNGRGSSSFEEWCTANDAFTVTFKNWRKYQEDSTAAERGRALRSKRRGEEKRGEEKKDPPITRPPQQTTWPENLIEVQERLTAIQAPLSFFDPEYWTRIDEWLGPEDSGVAYLGELDKYLAWIAGLPPRQRNRNHCRGFRNWLATAESRATEEKRRYAQSQTQSRRR